MVDIFWGKRLLYQELKVLTLEQRPSWTRASLILEIFVGMSGNKKWQVNELEITTIITQLWTYHHKL